MPFPSNFVGHWCICMAVCMCIACASYRMTHDYESKLQSICYFRSPSFTSEISRCRFFVRTKNCIGRTQTQATRATQRFFAAVEANRLVIFVVGRPTSFEADRISSPVTNVYDRLNKFHWNTMKHQPIGGCLFLWCFPARCILCVSVDVTIITFHMVFGCPGLVYRR